MTTLPKVSILLLMVPSSCLAINFLKELDEMVAADAAGGADSSKIPYLASAYSAASDRDDADPPALSPIEQFRLAYLARYNLTLLKYFDVSGARTDVGSDFPSIPGPKSKSARVAVVGAGPAGISMAYELKRRGFTDVTVFEKSDRVGGKSGDIFYRGIHNTMGTYLLTPDYAETITKFMQDNGLFNVADWVTRSRPANTYKVDPVPSMLLYSFAVTNDNLTTYMDAVDRYVQLHRTLFGVYEGEMMPEPSEHVRETHLQGSFYDFLERNDLLELRVTFDNMLAVPGYGRIATTAAIPGLMWLTPRHLVLGPLGAVGFHAVHSVGGFNAVFNKMIELEKIDIKFNHEVTGVRKTATDDIELSFRLQEDRGFDFLVWGALTLDFARVSENLIVHNKCHKKILETHFYKHATVALVNMRTDVRVGTSEVYIANVLDPSNRFGNRVALSVDNWAEQKGVAFEDYVARRYSIDGDGNARTRTLSVQVTGDTWEQDPEGFWPTEAQLVKTIRTHFESGFNATDVEVLAFSSHQYQPQWTEEEVGKGVHWDLFRMQGTDNVWFNAGGSTWDSTKSIMEYNRLLLKQSGWGHVDD